MIKKIESLDHEIEHGKKISKNAEEIWGWSSPAGIMRADRRTGYYITLGNFTKGDKLLEIGCGTALFTKKVYESTGADITAIDISVDLLNQAIEKLPAVTFKIDDAMNLSFSEASFTCVYGSSILHHLDFDKSLSEIYRVLKPNGRMVFAEPNMMNPQIMIQKNIPFIKKWMGDSPDETAIVRWSLKKKMEKIGFKNVKVFPYDFLHPSTPKGIISFIDKVGKFVEKIPLMKEIAGSVIIYGEK